MAHILITPSWYPITPDDVTGVFFRDQALALKEAGHKVGVITAYPRALKKILSKSNDLTEYENDHDIETYRSFYLKWLPYNPYGNYLLYRRVFKKLFNRYVEKHGLPDVIHAHSLIFAGILAEEIGRKFNLPTIVTEHSSGFARNLFQPWELKIAKKAMVNTNYRIAVSPQLGELLKKQFGVEWCWVPNIVAKRFATHKSKIIKSTQLKRFLNLAAMREIKGQKDLLLAFTSVLKNYPDAELLLAGDGPLRDELAIMVCELEIDKSVQFLGKVEPEKVPDLISEVDVMVIASHIETFGVVAAEALMMGKPVIATRCGGPQCIVLENDGLLVEPKSPQELAKAMIQMLATIEQYCASDIAERAANRFSGEVIAKQLTAIYQELIQAKRVKQE